MRLGMRMLFALWLASLAPGSLAASADPYAGSSGSWGQAYADQWGLTAIGWQAQVVAEPLAEVLVAIIDTGLDYYHPDLAGVRLYSNPDDVLNGRDDDGNGYVDDVIGWNFVDGNGNPWDQAGHGTHVTGVIAATTGNGRGVAGIAPNVRIMPLKVLNFIGRGTTTRVAEAIYYAVSKGARVINLSLGGEAPSMALQRAVDHAARHQVLVVLAAGNAGKEMAQPRFVDQPNLITVGAIDPARVRAGFSNYGPGVDLVAPGTDILSLRARRTDVSLVAGLADYAAGQNFVGRGAHYYRANGTSFAAPFVTAAAALLIGRDPKLDATSVKRMLLQSAKDLDIPGVDNQTGYGLLDLPGSLKQAPERFIDARVTGLGVVQRADGLFIQVSGIARADRFGEAWVETGKGDDPTNWRKAEARLTSPVSQGLLAELPAGVFDAPGRWTVRLTVTHADGTRREARSVLDIE